MKLHIIGKAAVIAMSIPLMTFAAESGREKATRLNDEGVKMIQAQDYKGALERFREALATAPDCVSAARNAGKMLIMAMKYKEAVELLEPTLAAVPDDPGCLVQAAQASALAGDSAKSIKYVERVAKLADKSIVRELSVLLKNQGSLTEAAVATELAVENEPKNPESWFARGLVADAVGNAEIAGESYERAVLLDPKYAEAWVNLGNLQKREKREDQMFACYENAYKAKKCPLTSYSLGRELVATRKDVSRGLDLLDEASQGDDVAAKEARAFIGRMTELLKERKGAK